MTIKTPLLNYSMLFLEILKQNKCMRLSKFYSTIAIFLFSLGACQNDSNTHNSNDVEAQYKKAKQGATSCFNKKEGCNEAIELFDKVIAIDSKHHLAFYNRGVCKMTISDFKGA